MDMACDNDDSQSFEMTCHVPWYDSIRLPVPRSQENFQIGDVARTIVSANHIYIILYFFIFQVIFL